MEIKVKCSCGQGSCPEWAIVELQGVLEVQPPFQDRLQNLPIGILCRSSSPETYTLTVGYHELTGSKVPLKKPFLVLKKLKHASGEEEEMSDGGGQDSASGSGSDPNVEMEVIGIIRHKILFKTRPRALISAAPQPAAKGKGELHNPSKEKSSPQQQNPKP